MSTDPTRPDLAAQHAAEPVTGAPAGAGPLTADPRTLEILARRRRSPSSGTVDGSCAARCWSPTSPVC